MAPKGMSKVYFGLSGSDANETNVKIVWYYNNVLGRPAKKKIIARHRAYHGATIMAGSLTGAARCSTRRSTCRSSASCARRRRTTTGRRLPA